MYVRRNVDGSKYSIFLMGTGVLHDFSLSGLFFGNKLCETTSREENITIHDERGMQ
jgi:hypothetical protein